MPDAALLNELAGIDPASLADADKSVRVMDGGIRPVGHGRRLLGVARTVRCNEDFLAVIRALDDSEPGEVLVVDTQGSQRAVVGELFSMESERRGLAGIVVDGPVRDTSTISELGIAVYARSFCPCSGTTRDLGQTQIEIQCGGVTVRPGDVLVGDGDGIVVASESELRVLVPVAMEIQRKEAVLRERMVAGVSLIGMLNYREHAAALERGEDSALQFRLDDET